MKYTSACLGLLLLPTAPTAIADAVSNQLKPMETITITSQRITRDSQSLASNSTYIDRDTIALLKLETIADLLNLAPNISMQTLAGDFDYIQMRGMPRNIEQATVGIYIDGVPYSNLYGLNLSLLNIESVEILRGAQANLFGRNARDGVIAITTAKPTQAQARLSGQISSNNGRQIQAHANTPLLDDTLNLSVQGQWFMRDGIVNNTHLGGHIDDVDQHEIRAAMRWQATDDVIIDASIERSKKDNGAYPYVSGQTQFKRGDTLSASLDTNNKFTLTTTTAALTIDWALASNWQLSSISSATDVEVFGRFDADFSELPYGYYDTWLDDNDLYQEFRLHHETQSIQWLLGASYSKNTDNNRNEYTLFGLNNVAKLTKRSAIVYGDVTLALANKWQVQAGGRWISEDFDAATLFINPLLPTPQASTQGNKTLSDSQWLGKVSLAKQIDEHQHVYINAGQGYLSGGVTWMAEDIDASFMRQGTGLSYAPEKSNNIELGYKSFWPSLNTRVELNAYQSQLDNFQHNYQDAFGLSHIVNIDRVTSRGLELALHTQFNDSLALSLNMGRNKSTITKIENTAITTVNVGNRIPNAAKGNLHAHLIYQDDITEKWAMNSALSINYRGDTSFDFNEPISQKSYHTMDLSLAFTHSSQWTVAIWGKNLTDTRYKQSQVKQATVNIAHYGMTREFGLKLTKSF